VDHPGTIPMLEDEQEKTVKNQINECLDDLNEQFDTIFEFILISKGRSNKKGVLVLP
jgi:hypothetical protein